ncbi:MAG: twin-arginine translocase TatA/TatE family subunit [Halobacteriovoraceae bacterium]|nr:twin-arginine translocase TatA/TatE family subunit [Halobacteriovoraceae bacterium]
MFGLGIGELAVVGGLVLLIFGGKKLPELGKGLGKGLRNFKEGLREIDNDSHVIENKNSEEKKISEN